MKKKLLYLIPLVVIGILIGIAFNNNNETKSQVSMLDIKLASYQDVQANDSDIVGTDYVKFDAYFITDKDGDGIADKIRGNCFEVDSYGKSFYVELNISGDAILKNANIEFDGQNVEMINSSTGKITSNITIKEELEAGMNKNYKFSLRSKLSNDITSYSKTNKVILTGTLVENGVEKEIRKEVDYTVDWYRTSVTSRLKGTGSSMLTNGNGVNVTYNLKASVTNGATLKSFNFETVVPKLNGYDPILVEVGGTNISYNYDSDTRMLTGSRDAVLTGNIITNSADDYIDGDENGINSITLNLRYPLEASMKDSVLSMNVYVWHELYNNPDPSFESILTSQKTNTIVYVTNHIEEYVEEHHERGPVPYLVGVSTYLANHSGEVDKTPVFNAYDGIENDETTEYKYSFNTKLYYTVGTIDHLFITEDQYDTFNSSDSMQDVMRYKTISFSYVKLYDDGYIKLINADNDQVIHIFNKDDWNTPYEFVDDVKRIKIETSRVNLWHSVCYNTRECDNNFSLVLSATVTKEFDNNLVSTNYTRSKFDTFSYLHTNIQTNVEAKNETVHYQNRDFHDSLTIPYRTPRSSTIRLSVDKTSIPTNEDSSVVLKVSSGEITDLKKGWKEGEFVITIPDEIIDAKITNIESENPDVNVIGYELDMDSKLIKILTTNTNPTYISISINMDITPDPRVADKRIVFNLYALNKYFEVSDQYSDDLYDLNNNGRTDDYVNYSSTSMNLNAFNEVRTISVVKIKDKNGADERVVVTPKIAEIDPTKDDTDAKVEISLVNNSGETVQDIVIIGHAGFVGNKYQLNNNDLDSKFSAFMSSDGIQVPSEIASNTIVYYSDVEKPTNDLDDVNNNWKLKEEISDFTTIKSYMIIVNNYVLNRNHNLIFSYTVELPSNTNYLNQASYVTHAVYYKKMTEDGLIDASPLEQRKTGLSMVRKYDMNLTNYKIFSSKTINNSTYLITDEDNKQIIVKTLGNGQLKVKNLYEGMTYTIKQTSVKYPYILDETAKTFKVINNGSDILELDSNTSDGYKNISITDTSLTIDLENEVRYDVILTNHDLDTNELIPYTKFRITGKGYEEGKIFATNKNGELYIKALYLDEEYTVENISSSEHLRLKDPFTFRLTRGKNNEISITRDYSQNYIFSKAHALNNTKNFRSVISTNKVEYEAENNVAYEKMEAYAELDLTSFYGEFKLDNYMHLWVNTGYYNIFIFTDLDNIPSVSDVTMPYSRYYPFDRYPTINIYDYNETTNEFDIKTTLEGGKKYYIYMSFTHDSGTGSDNFSFIFNPLLNLDSVPVTKLIVNDKVDYPVANNDKVLQTIEDSDNQDIPIFKLNVKSKKIPTYNFELYKVSADEKEPLKDAQYKITGYGLPLGGLFIKTDENGKASTTLIREVTAVNTSGNPMSINGYDYSEVSSMYSVQEVVPPEGYSIDRKEVKFSFIQKYPSSYCETHSINYNYTYDCTVDENSTFEDVMVYENIDKQFVDYSYNKDTNTLTVTMYDYPLIDITKRDAETGELLPNTMFAVYSVSYNGQGEEILTPARNPKGEILGHSIMINDKQYYVIATNEKGKLSLNLSSGVYKAIEVQAADEKYQIDDIGYYFSVGPTVEYDDSKLEFVGGIYSPDTSYFYYNDEMDDVRYNDIIPTSDGGWLVSTNNNKWCIDGWYCSTFPDEQVITIRKYDRNLNLEWESDAKKYITNVVNMYMYYDDPDRVEYEELTNSGLGVGYPSMYLSEVEDGYYVTIQNMGVIKFDKNGNRVWQNQDYGYANLTYYNALCYKDTGLPVNSNEYISSKFEYDPNNPHMQKDENTYYCTDHDVFDATLETVGGIKTLPSTESIMNYWPYEDTSFNTSAETIYQYDDDNNIIGSTTYVTYTPGIEQRNNVLRLSPNGWIISGGYNVNFEAGESIKSIASNHDGGVTLLTSDALRWAPYGQYILSDGTYYKYGSSPYPFRHKGDTCSVIFSSKDIRRGNCDDLTAEFGASFYSTRFDNLLHYTADGTFDGIDSLGRIKTEAIKLYNRVHNVNYSNTSYYSWGTWNLLDTIHTFENGDILVVSIHNGIIRVRYNETTHQYDPIYFIPPEVFASDSSSSRRDVQIHGNSFVIREDRNYGEGKKVYYVDENGNYSEDVSIFNTSDSLNFNPGIGYRNFNGFYKLPNGNYMVYAQINTIENLGTRGLQEDMIALSLSGKTIYKNLNIEDGKLYFIVYEMNDESQILWYKLYDITNDYPDGETSPYSEYWTDTPLRYNPVSNELLLLVQKHADLSITNVEDSSETYNSPGNILVFKLRDNTKPEAPEKYDVEIPNNRKVFKINVNSGENGKTNVFNGNNQVYTVINETQSVENIKYGDDSTFVIKPVGDPGYVVDKVLLDGKDFSYEVQDDGSIIIDKITNVTEDRNLTITFKPGNSIVIVHHYKKGTTEKIASDEIMSGLVNSPYETEPTFNPLYGLVTNENGEEILPDNMTGFFAVDPIVVIYYYEENLVNLKVNYYIKNTTLELAPSDITKQILGSSYKTTKKTILGYAVTDIIGEEEGILDRENTIVTYMYQSVDQTTLKIRYVDKDTGKDIADTITKIVNRTEEYETSAIEIEGYEYDSRTDNYRGVADTEEIEVIYYYVKEEVKGEENPKTGDNIINYLILFITSLIGILLSRKYIKKLNR